jgi:hypothetical protein
VNDPRAGTGNYNQEKENIRATSADIFQSFSSCLLIKRLVRIPGYEFL